MKLDYKEYLAKYFTNLISVITLVLGVVFLFNFYTEKERQKQERLLLEERYGRLIETETPGKLLKDSYQLASIYKTQIDLEKEARQAWKELAIERGERIKLMGDVTVTLKDSVQKQSGPDYQFKTPEGTDGFILNELRIDGEDSPPIGYIMIKDDGMTFKKNYKFQIKIENVQLKDDLTGKIRVVSRAYMVPLEAGLAEKRRPDFKDWTGERYPLAVTGGEVLIDPKEPLVPDFRKKDFIWWPMNLNVGFGVFSDTSGDTSAKLYADTNLFGYGFSKRDLDWKFLHLGVNYSDSRGVGANILPFTYRPIPGILVNTYVGPGYFLDSKGSGYFIGVNTGL